MNVVLTDEAEADFNGIIDYIAERNIEAALRFAAYIRTSCDELATSPQAYPLVPGYQHYGIRRRVIGNYLLFYRIGEDAIEVVHILHGARDYEHLLFPGE